MAAHSAALISTDDLARRLGAPALRVFDCTTYLKPGPDGRYIAESGRANYDKGHIPGAAFLDLQADLSDKNSKLRFTLPPLEELTKAFAAKGVGHGTSVVLYSHASPVWASRIWWMLRAIGFDDAVDPRRRPRQMEGGEPPALDRGHSASAGDPHLARPAGDLRRQDRAQGRDRPDGHAHAQCAQPRPAQGHAAASSTAAPAASRARPACRRRACSGRTRR